MTDLGARQRLELELILLVNSTPRQPDDHVCSCDVIPDLVHLCRNPTYLTKYLFTYERLCSFGGNTPTPCFHRCRRKLRNCNKVSLHFRSHKKQPPFIDPYGPHLSTTNDCVVYWCIQYCNCESSWIQTARPVENVIGIGPLVAQVVVVATLLFVGKNDCNTH